MEKQFVLQSNTCGMLCTSMCTNNNGTLLDNVVISEYLIMLTHLLNYHTLHNICTFAYLQYMLCYYYSERLVYFAIFYLVVHYHFRSLVNGSLNNCKHCNYLFPSTSAGWSIYLKTINDMNTVNTFIFGNAWQQCHEA